MAQRKPQWWEVAKSRLRVLKLSIVESWQTIWSGFRSWFHRNIYPLVVFTLCVPAYFVPNYLLKIGHNPPVGVYIAIMGGVAALVAYREKPHPLEKAAWMVLITLFIVAEIRNLYIADAEQVAKFGAISSALDATKRGLDATARGIDATAKALDLSVTTSSNQFAATMGCTNNVLTSITGGNSFGIVVPMLPNLLPGQDVPLAIENRGQHSLTGVSVTLYNTGLWMQFSHGDILRSVKNRISVGTLHAGERLVIDAQINPETFMAFDDDQGTKQFRVFIFISEQNFTVNEYLDFRKEKTGLWVYRYQTYKALTMSDIRVAANKKKISKEKFLEAVDWSHDANLLNTLKSQPDWH